MQNSRTHMRKKKKRRGRSRERQKAKRKVLNVIGGKHRPEHNTSFSL